MVTAKKTRVRAGTRFLRSKLRTPPRPAEVIPGSGGVGGAPGRKHTGHSEYRVVPHGHTDS